MKVSILTINGNFVQPLVDELMVHHDVEIYKHRGNEAYDYQNIRALLNWCDVAFVDFCFYPLPQITSMAVIPCKIVARLHGLEIYTQAKSVDWSKVNTVIATPPQAMRLREWNIPSYIHVENIGTNTELFEMWSDRDYGKNICMIGNIIAHKRVYTTIQTIAPLLKDGWKLTLHGNLPTAWRKQERNEYIEMVKELIEILEVKDSVVFHDRLAENEYVTWLNTQDVVISNSTMEGYHKSIFDAMSCGVYPLVNCWYGADLLYPEANIFYSQNELLEKIRKWYKLSARNKKSLSHELRRYVMVEHSQTDVAKRVREVIEHVAAE